MLEIPSLSVTEKIKSIAVLTSGGDAPGMNAAVRSVVRYGLQKGLEIHGVIRGYQGLLEGEIETLTASSVANIIQRGGTILKTARCEDFLKKSARREAANILRRNKIEALVVIGGDGSFRGAHLLEKETNFPTIGLPGTIDNDIFGSDDTIGFDTAVNTALEAIDRIRDTASSHDRTFIVEVMGRSSGFIGLLTGISGGAETIVMPEEKTSISSICSAIEQGIKRGKTSSILVVSEGEKPGLSQRIAKQLHSRGHGTKVCILGHTQRGGSPTAHDRLMGSVLGASAVAHLLAGKSNAMVGVQNGRVTLVPFAQIFGKKKPIQKDLIALAKQLAT